MKQRSFFLILMVLLGLVNLRGAAQPNRPVRLEIPVKDDSEIYKVVPCDENGVMIIYLSTETDDSGKMLWVEAFLDRNLKELWRKSIALPRGFSLAEALYANNHLVGFWYSTRGSEEENLRIADVRVNDSALRISALAIPEKSDLPEFAICNSYALAGINTRDEKAVFMRYDLNSGVSQRIDPGSDGDVAIESINIDPLTEQVSLVLRTTGTAKKRAYYLVKLDRNGNKISELTLSKFDDNNMVNTAFAYRIDPNTDLIIGSYGRNARTRIVEGREVPGVSSTGFFSILVRNNTEVKTNFFEFSDLPDFYRYLRKPSDLNMRRGANRTERSNRDFSIDHELLAHDVFRWDSSYVFIAEAYYPEYRTVTTMVYDYYGRPYPSTYSVFEGYRYLTTFIAGFDSTGAMKWNNDLELRNIITPNLRRKVLAWEDPDGLVLSYTDDARISSKILYKGGTTSSNISYTDIAPLSPRDKVYSDSNSNITAWYADFFLVYGYQNIRNSYLNDRNNKNIFYLSKLAFR